MKYSKVINEISKECEVGIGTDVDYYQSQGMTEQEVEQAYNGNWYLKGFAPVQPASEVAQAEINRLEALQTPRLMREAFNDAQAGLTTSYAIDKLKEIDDAIAVQRAILTGE